MDAQDKELLLNMCEEIGHLWGENIRVEDIRLNIDQLNILLGVNYAFSKGKITAAELEAGAPSFCHMYREVMLRDTNEVIHNGNDAEGTD